MPDSHSADPIDVVTSDAEMSGSEGAALQRTPEELLRRVGKEIAVSPWVEVSQDLITRFGELTGDLNPMHVDSKWAAQSQFGTTIAHGFLILSLLGRLGRHSGNEIAGAAFRLNYGFDRIRMIAPVRSGKRIRARFVLKAMRERAPREWTTTLGVTVEIEGEPRPALDADWIDLQIVR